MKLKKQNIRKKSVSPNLDTLDDYNDDDLCSTDDKGSPLQRNTANARERARMRVLSSAFYRLKTIIPWVPHDTKLSKLDTLRLARNYISYLSATLSGESVNEISTKLPPPQKMTWPYIFPDLNANKISNSSRKENSSNKRSSIEVTSRSSENSQKFTPPYEHQDIRQQFYNMQFKSNGDDYENMSYE